MSNILENFVTRAALAADLNVSERTIWRYENLPNGLPSVLIGGRKLYRRESVLAWLAKRERTRNNIRKAA